MGAIRSWNRGEGGEKGRGEFEKGEDKRKW